MPLPLHAIPKIVFLGMFVVLDFFRDKAILVEDILKRLSNINHSEFFPEVSQLEKKYFITNATVCNINFNIRKSVYRELVFFINS